MKKTLITLLALAGTVSATDSVLWSTGFAEVTDANAWNTANEVITEIQSSDWSLKNIKPEEPVTLGSKTGFAQLRPDVNVGDGTGTWKLSFTLTNQTDAALVLDSIVFDTVIFTGGNGYQGTNTTRKFNFTLNYDGVELSHEDWSISGTGNENPTNGIVTFNLGEDITLANKGDFISFDFIAAQGTSETLGCFVGLKGISATGAVVPEPTTATLSLLALAGLAARRRRK